MTYCSLKTRQLTKLLEVKNCIKSYENIVLHELVTASFSSQCTVSTLVSSAHQDCTYMIKKCKEKCNFVKYYCYLK